jgi:hypothetical protein
MPPFIRHPIMERAEPVLKIVFITQTLRITIRSRQRLPAIIAHKHFLFKKFQPIIQLTQHLIKHLHRHLASQGCLVIPNLLDQFKHPTYNPPLIPNQRSLTGLFPKLTFHVPNLIFTPQILPIQDLSWHLVVPLPQ